MPARTGASRSGEPLNDFNISVTRFAPSPNGPLHLGHALSALTGYRLARAGGGRFLLRIEDIDGARTRDEHVQGIEEDLSWLGVSWETPVLRQSQRFAAYGEAAERLRGMGLLYPCFATRSEIAAAAGDGARDPDGAQLYPDVLRQRMRAETSERLARGELPAWRIDMARAIEAAAKRLDGRALTFRELCADGTIAERAAHPERWGDAVIVRKDVAASYHLAVVVDDAWQGVTHVTRGADLLAATDVHRLLQVLLGLPEPIYFHHRLVLGADGAKLSKSAGAEGIGVLRAAGAEAEKVIAGLGVEVPILAWSL